MNIGILGGGQLARMLALSAYPLGLRTICFDPNPEPCAQDVTTVIKAAYGDEPALLEFAKQVDVITIENENLPVEILSWLNTIKPVLPNPLAVGATQDRLLEKQLLQSLNIPTADFYSVNSLMDVQHAVKMFNLPVVLKTRRFGYDGKGQYIIRHTEEIQTAWESLGKENLIVEKFIAFEREVSLIAVRNAKNDVCFYPLTENVHKNGILYLSRAPFIDEILLQQAKIYMQNLLQNLNYVGVLAIEFFVQGHQLMANEIAPRVHNSGHWTIEGAFTSQFENHMRAVSGLPLGDTSARAYSVMLNCVGTEPTIAEVLKQPNAHYHSYHKTPKPNRKLAHITVCTNNIETREKQLTALEQLLNKS